MPKKVSRPKVCPVCGRDSLQPVTRHPLGTSEADKKIIAGLIGFRCGRGHVFLISASDLIRTPGNTPKAERASRKERDISTQTKPPNRAKDNKKFGR